MSIKCAMLGFLSWMPMSGYDIKKLFVDSETLYWSGNNNQIYKTLVELHEEELVTKEVQYQEDHPPRKIYTITDKGRQVLKQWVLSKPELPQIKGSFLVQLAWADQLQTSELDGLLRQYEEEAQVELLMLRERQQRQPIAPNRTERETYLWRMITENRILFYENELNWVQQVRGKVNSE